MKTANLNWLFETGALVIAPPEQPFFYTSGLIGPYFINTHYLAGGKESAEELLAFINTYQENRAEFPELLLPKLQSAAASSAIFQGVITLLADKIRAMKRFKDVAFISGGQRRDWFFAPLVAEELNLPCLYIYKDKEIITRGLVNLEGSTPLGINVADLLNVGSSYSDHWIPAINSFGGSLIGSACVVDRNEGAQAALSAHELEFCELFLLSDELFEEAVALGAISESQMSLVKSFRADPFESMRSFLVENSGFLEAALRSENRKERERAEKLVALDLYRLKLTNRSIEVLTSS